RASRRLVDQLLEADLLDTARKLRVAVIDLVRGFFSGDMYFLCVHDNDVIAGVHVRGVFGLVLAAQPMRKFRSKTTQSLACRIDDEPVALHSIGFCTEGFHFLASSARFR